MKEPVGLLHVLHLPAIKNSPTFLLHPLLTHNSSRRGDNYPDTGGTPDRSNERYSGIWMMEDGEVFISGWDLSTGEGIVRRSNKDLRGNALANTSWSQVSGLDWSTAIVDIWGTGDTLFFIASGPGTGGAVYKYDRASDLTTSWDLAGHPYAADVWGLDENSVYFLTSDSIVHYDSNDKDFLGSFEI